ncbi:bacteriocin [Staphylococcus xylosus]|uniref:bacteriocin n=1 Tax=Staphylococcus xylosus TaxID=1288 RepID=UPI003CEE1394
MKLLHINEKELKSITGGSNSFIEKFWGKEGKGLGRYTKLVGQLQTANAKAAHGQNPN